MVGVASIPTESDKMLAAIKDGLFEKDTATTKTNITEEVKMAAEEQMIDDLGYDHAKNYQQPDDPAEVRREWGITRGAGFVDTSIFHPRARAYSEERHSDSFTSIP